jgi:hypothetical protein
MKTKMSPTVFYVAALIVFIVGIASLVNDITDYIKAVSVYVAQGYTVSAVAKQLLLPPIFQAVGMYFGIAFILFGIGVVIHHITLISAPAVAEAAPAELTDTVSEDEEYTADTEANGNENLGYADGNEINKP